MRPPFNKLTEKIFKKKPEPEPGIPTPGVNGVPIPEGTNRGGPSGGGAHRASRNVRLNSGQHRSTRW